MANGVVVVNADRVEGALKPPRPVLPLDCLVDQARAVKKGGREAATCEDVAGELGVASVETQGIDTCALTAVFHRLLPEWAMRALPGRSEPGRSENRQVHAQIGGLTLKQAGDVTMQRVGDLAEKQAGDSIMQPIVEPGHERVSISGPGHLRSAEGAAVEQPSGSVPIGTMASQFDMTPPESTRERQTVLTQFPQEGLIPAKDADTLRLTYPFRSWQGQPVAMVSFNFHEAGRRLRVEAPDRGVYAALLANRSALPGTVQIVDGDRHSHGRDGRRPEEGE